MNHLVAKTVVLGITIAIVLSMSTALRIAVAVFESNFKKKVDLLAEHGFLREKIGTNTYMWSRDNVKGWYEDNHYFENDLYGIKFEDLRARIEYKVH